jgi:putative membrane protein
MKKITYLMMLAFAAYAFQSCHSGGSTTTADSSSTTTDTAKKTVIDTAKVDTGDVKFAKTLAGGGMAEINFSKLALQKVAAGKLKDFANMMVTDHTKAADTLMAIAAKENIALPADLDAGHQSKYDAMQKMSGDDFNKAYVTLMIADHKDAVNLLTNESANGKDPALKAFATKILPTVQGHLDAANKLQTGMK